MVETVSVRLGRAHCVIYGWLPAGLFFPVSGRNPFWWKCDLDESEVSEDWLTRYLAGTAGVCVESE